MNAPTIHDTAVVGTTARLGANVVVGPYAVVADEVVIGAGTSVGPHAVIDRYTRVGINNRIGAHAVLGGEPQDTSFTGGETWLDIGDYNTIREGVTIHRATHADRPTRLGSHCYLMAYAHIGHDCQVGDRCVLSNNVMLGGHAELGEQVTMGGNAGVHQYTRVGTMAMVAGYIAVRQDVLPFSLVAGSPVRHYRLNTIGLRRAGVSGERYRALERAFRALRAGANHLELPPDTPELKVLDVWLRRTSKRGIYQFASRARKNSSKNGDLAAED